MTQAIHMPVHVTPEEIEVKPGTAADINVSVFNTSEIIDAFVVDVIGADNTNEPDHKGWVARTPEEVRLFPDKADAVQVAVTVPMHFPAGKHLLSVRVTSQTTGQVVATAPVRLTVAEWPEAQMELDPEQVVGGRTGRFGAVLTNKGNVALDVRLAADDKTNELSYAITPQHHRLEPGENGVSQVVVSGSRPWTGIPLARQFTLTATSGELKYDRPATFVSDPWIPRWALTFLSIALLLGLWAFIVGLAIDAIIEDGNEDLTSAFADGMEAVVEAIDPDAMTDAALGQAGSGSAALLAANVVRGPEGTIAGEMGTGVDGSAIPGATVVATPLVQAGSKAGQIDTSRDPVETVVGEDGTFVFEDMVVGDYILIASAPGFEVSTVPEPGTVYECPASDPPCVSVPVDLATAEPIMFSLNGKPGLISGVVLLEGEPNPGSLVEVNRLVEPELETSQTVPSGASITDVDGRFAFEPLETPASYEVVLTTPGFVTQRIVVPLEAGQRILELEVPIVATGVGNVSGTVSDRATGAALGGVSVQIASSGGDFSILTTTLTVATGGKAIGTYELTGVPEGDYTATFQLEGYDDAAIPFVVNPASPLITLNPALSPSAGPNGARIGTVSGRVTDSLTGDGLGGVSVVVSGPSGSFTTSTFSTAVGSQPVGSFLMTGLPIGSYTASYSALHYQAAALPFTLTATDATAAVNAQLDIIPTPVTGTVLVITGTTAAPVTEPLPGVTLLFDPTPGNPDDALVTLGTTDAVGGFAVSMPATPGIRTIILGGEFLVPTIDVAIDPGTPVDAGTTTVVRLFTPPGSLRDQFGRLLRTAAADYAPPLTGDVAAVITNLVAANDLFSIDLADPAYEFTFPIDQGFDLPELPGPGTYTLRFTLPAGSQQLVETNTLTTPIDATTTAATFTVPFADGVLWATARSGGQPVADDTFELVSVQVVVDPVTGIETETELGVVDTQATDGQGRVTFGPVTNVDTLRLRWIRDGAPPVTCDPRLTYTNWASASMEATVTCTP